MRCHREPEPAAPPISVSSLGLQKAGSSNVYTPRPTHITPQMNRPRLRFLGTVKAREAVQAAGHVTIRVEFCLPQALTVRQLPKRNQLAVEMARMGVTGTIIPSLLDHAL